MPRQLIYLNDHDCQGASRKSLCLSLGLSAGQLELERISTLVSSWLSVIFVVVILFVIGGLTTTAMRNRFVQNCRIQLPSGAVRPSHVFTPLPSYFPHFLLGTTYATHLVKQLKFQLHAHYSGCHCMYVCMCVCVFLCVRNGLLNLAKKKRKQQQSAKPRSPC